MKFLFAAFLLLTSCATLDPEITRKSGLRRHAGYLLWSCIRDNMADPEVCRAPNYEWCIKHNLEKTCGIDDAWDMANSSRLERLLR